jgi:hypothetical protein
MARCNGYESLPLALGNHDPLEAYSTSRFGIFGTEFHLLGPSNMAPRLISGVFWNKLVGEDHWNFKRRQLQSANDGMSEVSTASTPVLARGLSLCLRKHDVCKAQAFELAYA